MKIHIHSWFILLFLAASAFAQTNPPKKLIEFGWDQPDCAFMRAHIAEMEATPFDGTVFNINGTFQNECWGTKTFTEADVKPSLDDLKATPFKQFTENFLRFNVMPGNVDWFDDFNAILANARLAAKVAREGKARGILFDIEQYNNSLFDYRKQRDVKTKSFDQYAAQVRQRGREVMKAFQEGYPDVPIFLTFGYSLPYAQAGTDRAKLAQVDYGLLAPLLDGMLDAAEGNSKIIDGYEISYGYKNPQKFKDAVQTIHEKILPLVADPEKYKKRVSLSFGLWMDNDWRKNGWNETDFTKNYFTPEVFGNSVKHALEHADEYVWIYTETPRWWSKDGQVKLPKAYDDAVRKAAETK